MPIHAAAPRRRLPRMALALALGLTACPIFAAPDAAADSIAKFLSEPGLIAEPTFAPAEAAPAETTGLMREVHDRAAGMVVAAMNFVGVRYRRGGTSADTGFDCSGFTRHVFEMSAGLVLPRRVDEQAAAPGLVAVKREDLKPGDLVFFNTLKRTFSHVGIYIGDNRFIHSPRTGQRVRTEDLSFAYWAKRFTGARRVEASTVVDKAAPAATTMSATAGE
jgi:cell wall-associated NlpC family hydrolase